MDRWEIADALGGHLVTARGPRDAELVDAVRPGEDKRVDVSESMQHLSHHGREPRIRNPEQLMAHPSGFASGPSMLNTVRMPSSLRTGAT